MSNETSIKPTWAFIEDGQITALAKSGDTMSCYHVAARYCLYIFDGDSVCLFIGRFRELEQAINYVGTWQDWWFGLAKHRDTHRWEVIDTETGQEVANSVTLF